MASNRYYASFILPGLVRQGYSANAAVQYLIDLKTPEHPQGIGYRRTTALDDYRKLQGVAKKEELVKYIRPEHFIPDDYFVSDERDLGTKYLYDFKVVGYNTLTGETIEGYRSYGLNRAVRMRGELEDEMTDFLTSGEGCQVNVYTAVTLTLPRVRKGG